MARMDLAFASVSEAITRCAMERKESRGGHFRDDFPDKDPAFATFNFVVKKGRGGEMELTREPIPLDCRFATGKPALRLNDRGAWIVEIAARSIGRGLG